VKVEKAVFMKSVFHSGDLPSEDLPELAFTGRSNVGKSSLINTLVGIKGLARISSVPGKTRSINFFLINDRVRFVDLPGYGYARVPFHLRKEWKHLVEAYFDGRKNLCLVVLILDIRRDPSETEVELLKWIADRGFMASLVATKADKLSRHKRLEQLAVIEDILGMKPIPFSSITKEGKRELWGVIDRAIEIKKLKNAF